jgi:Protein of unknown function (DUF1393).
MSYVKKSMITAVCIALCVVLPILFHSIPNSGSILCPMHIPVLICGLICGWHFGLFSGIAGVLLSSVITGMPPVPYLPPMLIELAVYGLIAGLCMLLIRTKKIYADLYISLISAMLIGRIVSGVLKALIFSPGNYSIAMWTTSYFVTSLPGIAIQLALIPTIIFALEKANLIPARYARNA